MAEPTALRKDLGSSAAATALPELPDDKKAGSTSRMATTRYSWEHRLLHRITIALPDAAVPRGFPCAPNKLTARALPPPHTYCLSRTAVSHRKGSDRIEPGREEMGASEVCRSGGSGPPVTPLLLEGVSGRIISTLVTPEEGLQAVSRRAGGCRPTCDR